MKPTLTVFFSLLYFMSYCQTLVSTIRCLNRNNSISYFEQKGNFQYLTGDSGGTYKAQYNGATQYKIEYVKYTGEKRDQLILGKKKIYLVQKLEPLDIKFYKVNYKGAHYYCFIGRAESASGTGNQVFFYVLVKQHEGHFGDAKFFDSRFGSVYNIGDFDASGNLEYFKVSYRNGGGMQGYVGQVNCIRNDSLVDSTKYINLERAVDGEYFYLKEYNWFTLPACLEGVKGKKIYYTYCKYP